jgi:hypothetical protein
MRRSAVLALVLLVAGAPPAAAARLGPVSSTLAMFVYEVAIAPIGATVDLKPESLERRGTGVPMTAIVELPTGSDVALIDPRTVRLCVAPGPCAQGAPVTGKPKVGDADGDGMRDLKVAFDRSRVLALVDQLMPPVDVAFAISGLVGAEHFVGVDVVRLVP